MVGSRVRSSCDHVRTTIRAAFDCASSLPCVQACTLHRCCSSTRDGVFRHVSAIHVLFVVFPFTMCQSSSARALLPASCRIFSCSGARRSIAVHFFHRMGPRTVLGECQPTTPSEVVSSVVSKVRWDTAALCIAVSPSHASRTGHHQLHACPPPDPHRCCFCVTIWFAWRGACGNTICSLFPKV